MRKFRILLVYPDPSGLSLLTSMLKSLGHSIEEAPNDRVAVRLMEHNEINLVLAGVDPGDGDALELLTYVRRKHPQTPVILMFPRVHPERAKEALRLGAMAVLKYPVPAAELRATVSQALEQVEVQIVEATNSASLSVAAGTGSRGSLSSQGMELSAPATSALMSGVRALASGFGQSTALSLGSFSSAPVAAGFPATRTEELARAVGLIGGDAGLRQIVEFAGALASTRSTVLVLGEPGVGKSLLARLIHAGGGRPDRPFVTLRAVELEAAATHEGEEDARPPGMNGATSDWTNKLAQARGGTLYIEEVAALSPDLQLQVLRQLQLQDMEAVTGQAVREGRADVRIVLSTSDNLPALVEQGRFRQDLYHRINAICLMVPPLRLRGDDIELLAEHFRNTFVQEFHKTVLGFSRDALETLQRHDWPGNVRELQGVIQRAVALCTGPRITSGQLAPILSPHRQSRSSGASQSRPHLTLGIRPLKEALEEPEKRIIVQALQALNWNRQETAKVLDINRTTLYKKMKKYGLLMDEPIWVN